MDQYKVFKSEGGFRFAGLICNGGPVLSHSPWFKTFEEAVKASKEKRQKDIENANDEMDRLGLEAADFE